MVTHLRHIAWATLRRGIVFAAIVTAVVPAVVAQDVPLDPRHHAWGNFADGSWVLVRIITETLDSEGNVSTTSTTQRKTTLIDLANQVATLRVDASVEVAGKQFEAAPVSVLEGFGRDVIEDGATIKPSTLESETITVDGRKVVCRVEQFESSTKAATTVTKVFYNEGVEPYILRVDSTTTDPATKDVISQRTVETLALDMPYEVDGKMISTALQQETHKDNKGTTKTLLWCAPGVPGGVVGSTSKEMDPMGKPIRRSWLELIDYGAMPRPAEPRQSVHQAPLTRWQNLHQARAERRAKLRLRRAGLRAASACRPIRGPRTEPLIFKCPLDQGQLHVFAHRYGCDEQR